MKLSVWAEFMDPQEIRENLRFLAKYNVGIALAFSARGITQEYATLFREMNDLKIDFYLWALLPDEDGYWINERNVEKFDAFIDRILTWPKENGFSIPGFAIDMEPPLQQMKSKGMVAKINFIIDNLNRKRFNESKRKFQDIADRLRVMGIRTVAPIAFNIAHEMLSGRSLTQNVLETPIVDWDLISPMIYATMFPLSTGGFISREDARWYGYKIGKKFTAKMGARASISVGTIGPGKLGTGETTEYKKPEEIVPDIKAALAAGFEEIFIFNLKGLAPCPEKGRLA